MKQMRVVEDVHFIGADGVSVDVLAAGTLVEVLAESEIRPALTQLGMRPWIPGTRAPEQGWLDLMAWFGPSNAFGYPKIPQSGEDDYFRRWKGAKDRHPGALPFIWNGRFRYLDPDRLVAA